MFLVPVVPSYDLGGTVTGAYDDIVFCRACGLPMQRTGSAFACGRTLPTIDIAPAMAEALANAIDAGPIPGVDGEALAMAVDRAMAGMRSGEGLAGNVEVWLESNGAITINLIV